VTLVTAPRHEDPAGLEIDADERFQRIQWRVQQWAWAALALVPAAALLGMFGGGAASRRTVETPFARATYERFARREARTALHLRVRQPRPAMDSVRVALDTAYASALNLVEIVPSPRTMRAVGDAIELTFAVDPASEAAGIRFESRPRHWGRLTGQVAVNGVALPPLQHFVWP